jgi:hypothetical protein
MGRDGGQDLPGFRRGDLTPEMAKLDRVRKFQPAERRQGKWRHR